MTDEQQAGVGIANKEPVTSGEIAYNAYCNTTGWKSLVSGAQLPEFYLLKEEIQAAWQSAAQAVIDFNTPAAVEKAA